MKTKITLFLFFFSISIWSQTSSGSGTTTSGGGGGGIKVTISSFANSNSIEILPVLIDAKLVGYKIYDSKLELKKEVILQPTNNEIIIVDDMSKDHYYIQLIIDKELEEANQIICKQFYKE